MNEIKNLMQQWKLDKRVVRERMYHAPTARERERWHAIWLLSLGWTASQVAEALERDPHTIGEWEADFRRDGPEGMTFVQSGGCPPLSTRSSKPS